MKRVILILCLAACHAKEVKGPGEEEKQSVEQHRDVSGAHSRLERKPKKKGEPIVTSSPERLLEAKAPKKIQRALLDHGVKVKETGKLDQQTHAALRQFQKDDDLAEHGMPDDLTLRRLGLDPQEVYRGASKDDAPGKPEERP